MNMKTSTFAALCALGLAGLSGCTPEQLAEAGLETPAASDIEETAPIGETEQGMINGNAVARGSLARLGIVRVNFGCTGTMLSNRFVLTARHCVRTWANGAWGAAAANVQVTLEGATAADDQVIQAARVLEPNTNGVNAGDYALIELNAPLEVDGSTDGFYNPIYGGRDSDLEGQRVFCAGYGNNTEANGNVWGGGGGTLRSAWLTISDTGGNTLTLSRNRGNQIGAPGDSGSTCFLNGEILGVQSTCAGPWTDLNGDNQLQGGEWTRINTCTAASPNAYRAWVRPRIEADVLVEFPTVPPSGGAVVVRMSAVNDGFAFWNWGSASIGEFALRGGWLEATADDPAGYVCGRAFETTPARGDAVLRGACLSHALAASVSM